MFRPITAAGAVLAAATLALVPGNATAGAQHDLYEEEYDGSFHVSAEENPCGAWPATLREVRSGDARLVAAPGGQQPGEFHVNGAIDGTIAIVPDDPALPTYTGSYREKLNAIITGFDPDEGDVARIAQYRLRAPLTGSDGSRLVLALSGKVTVDATGSMVVGRDAMSCH